MNELATTESPKSVSTHIDYIQGNLVLINDKLRSLGNLVDTIEHFPRVNFEEGSVINVEPTTIMDKLDAIGCFSKNILTDLSNIVSTLSKVL